MNLQIKAATLEKIAEHLVSDQLTHEVMDRRFRTLNITEPTPTEPDHYKRLARIHRRTRMDGVRTVEGG